MNNQKAQDDKMSNSISISNVDDNKSHVSYSPYSNPFDVYLLDLKGKLNTS